MKRFSRVSRRDPQSATTRVLAWLNEYPGLTSLELALALGIPKDRAVDTICQLLTGFFVRHDGGSPRARRYRLTNLGLESLEGMQRRLDRAPENIHARAAEAGAPC